MMASKHNADQKDCQYKETVKESMETVKESMENVKESIQVNVILTHCGLATPCSKQKTL